MKIISGLANGQVLQRLGRRGGSARLTGTCRMERPLLATIICGRRPVRGWNKRVVGHARAGKFTARLAGIPAGGPYALRLQCGTESTRAPSFFVGDVWILAGQSNMEGVGQISGKARPHPLVRAFSMRRVWRRADDPLHIVGESPDRCHHDVRQFSVEEGEEKRRATVRGTGVGVFFGREMLARSGVPQGLICVAHGGTGMQQWSPERRKLGVESLYASMLESVRATDQPVAGILWYQGENETNAQDAPLYTARMRELVSSFRRDLRQPGLPWLVVQIARVLGRENAFSPWNEIQEQQRLLPSNIRALETVAAIDLPLDDIVHIGADGYPLLAKRLARMADRMVHGNKRELPPPQPLSTRVVGRMQEGVVEVKFKNVVGGLRSNGAAQGFTFISESGEPLSLIYRTVLKRESVVLLLCQPLTIGIRLTYGCGPAPSCNITDGRGFSLPVFGPLPISGNKQTELPFVRRWTVSEIIPRKQPVDRVVPLEMREVATTVKTYDFNGFISEHDRWVDNDGLCFFMAKIKLSEPMKLRFLMGYDGPFRLWLDRKSFFLQMAGTNPCVADEGAKVATLKKGIHEIQVGMDLRGGLSWGFFLRFARLDVGAKRRASGDYPKPEYLPG